MVAQRRNNIILVKRDTPKKVTLPNGRTIFAKYRRVNRHYLPGNVKIQRMYKGRPVAPIGQGAPKRRQRRRRVPGQLVGGPGAPRRLLPRPLQIRALNAPKRQTGKGLGDAVKAVAENPYVQEVDRKLINQGISSLPKLYKRATGRIKSKNLRKLAQSDAANYIVEKSVEKGFEGLL